MTIQTHYQAVFQHKQNYIKGRQLPSLPTLTADFPPPPPKAYSFRSIDLEKQCKGKPGVCRRKCKLAKTTLPSSMNTKAIPSEELLVI